MRSISIYFRSCKKTKKKHLKGSLFFDFFYYFQSNKIEDLRSNTYELCYNKCCALIANGLYNEAEKKLRECETLCREYFEEDEITEEELDIELALIR